MTTTLPVAIAKCSGPLFRWGPLTVLLWVISALPGLVYLTFLEGLTAAGLLATAAIVRVLETRKRRVLGEESSDADFASFRLAWVFLFLSVLAQTVPVFQTFGRTIVAAGALWPPFFPGLSLSDSTAQAVPQTPWLWMNFTPFAVVLLLEFLDRLTPYSAAVGVERKAAGLGVALERFFTARRPRMDLIAGALLLGALGPLLAESQMYSVRINLALSAGNSACFVLLLRPLLRLCRAAGNPSSAGFRRVWPAVGILAPALLGAALVGWRWERVWTQTNEGIAALARDEEENARRAFAEADRLNVSLSAKAPDLAAERVRAVYHERKEEWDAALRGWERVARLSGRRPEDTDPILRLWCRRGDSLLGWRRFVFQGPRILQNPELLDGFRKVGDYPNANLTGRLLAAFADWINRTDETELRRRLRSVLAANPRDMSATALLNCLAGKASPLGAELTIDGELFVAEKPTRLSPRGTIAETGRVSAAAVLEPGVWEIELDALGTPLDDLWPAVRLDINGKPYLSQQVRSGKRAWVSFDCLIVDDHNLHRLTLVFTNREEQFVEGRFRQRGLEIFGLRFRRTADSPRR
jgi:hypothetical protein